LAPTVPGAGNEVGVDDDVAGAAVVGDVVGAGAAVVVVTGGFVVVVVGAFVVVVEAVVVGVGTAVVTVDGATVVVVLTVPGFFQFFPRLSCADAGMHPAMMTAPVTRPAIRIA
jgi:hypothetical protein